MPLLFPFKCHQFHLFKYIFSTKRFFVVSLRNKAKLHFGCGQRLEKSISARRDTRYTPNVSESDMIFRILMLPWASANTEMKALVEDKWQIAINTDKCCYASPLASRSLVQAFDISSDTSRSACIKLRALTAIRINL